VLRIWLGSDPDSDPNPICELSTRKFLTFVYRNICTVVLLKSCHKIRLEFQAIRKCGGSGSATPATRTSKLLFLSASFQNKLFIWRSFCKIGEVPYPEMFKNINYCNICVYDLWSFFLHKCVQWITWEKKTDWHTHKWTGNKRHCTSACTWTFQRRVAQEQERRGGVRNNNFLSSVDMRGDMYMSVLLVFLNPIPSLSVVESGVGWHQSVLCPLPLTPKATTLKRKIWVFGKSQCSATACWWEIEDIPSWKY
jgi:hypothetical protein